jgi:hypothetical protein
MWYYVPCISAPVTEDSSSPFEESPAPWLTLSGTPTQRPLSWRGWASRPWIKHLCGEGRCERREGNHKADRRPVRVVWVVDHINDRRATKWATGLTFVLSPLSQREGSSGERVGRTTSSQAESERHVPAKSSGEGAGGVRRQVRVLWRGSTRVSSGRSHQRWRGGGSPAHPKLSDAVVLGNLPPRISRVVEASLPQLQLRARLVWRMSARKGASCSKCLNSAPDTAGSPLRLGAWQKQFATSSAIHTPRPCSSPGCAKGVCLLGLSGLTSPRSTLHRGVDEWIWSLPVSPVSPSPLPANAVDLTMTAGSGPTSPASSVRFDPVSCSWKTCEGLFELDYPLSSMTLPTSGSMRNGVCTPQPPLVPLTSGNESGLWPTTTTKDAARSGGNPNTTGTHGVTLTDRAVRMWGTPVARDDQKSPDAHMAMKARMDRNTATSLTVQAKMWGTPRASDAARGSDPIRTNAKAGAPTLKSQATAFPHDPTTTTDGPNGTVLNPRFVEALMGLPDGWLTSCTLEETDSSPKPHAKPGTNSPDGSE